MNRSMNKSINRPSASCFVVCPKSGLSYTIHADWNANVLSTAIHPDAADYMKMARTIRTHLHKIPKSYIAAFCQVWARDNNLLLEGKKAYASGFITETLAKIARKDLINLFWTCYNSTAGINKHPIKINLDDVHSPEAVHDMFITVAIQSTCDITHRSSKSVYKPRLKGTAKSSQHHMDIQACINRISKLLPKIANADPSDTIPVASAKKAAILLPTYASIRSDARERVRDIIHALFTWAMDNDYYTRESLEYRSYDVVIRHLDSKTTPAIMEEVEF